MNSFKDWTKNKNLIWLLLIIKAEDEKVMKLLKKKYLIWIDSIEVAYSPISAKLSWKVRYVGGKLTKFFTITFRKRKDKTLPIDSTWWETHELQAMLLNSHD